MNNSDPEEIYLEPQSDTYAEEGRMWCEDNTWDSSDYDGNEPVKYIRADLANLNPWISVKERLPGERKALSESYDVEITIIREDGSRVVDKDRYDYLFGGWGHFINVIAWRPLPKPYKGE